VREVRRVLAGNPAATQVRGLVRDDGTGKQRKLRLHLVPADGAELVAPVLRTDVLAEQPVTVYGELVKGRRVVVVADGRVIWPAGRLAPGS
jgi:hypothetical protein